MKNVHELTREERLRYMGHTDQSYAVRRVIADEGHEKGSTEYEVTTGGGLSYTLSADNALDIARLSYRGVGVNYLTKNNITANVYGEVNEAGFVRYFPAGMLYTCGLLNAGGFCTDGGVVHPSHGRFHNQPAVQVGSSIEDDKIRVRGVVSETEFSGYALRVTRSVTSPVGGASIVIEDTLENLTPNPTEYMLLYHFNFGWPFLSEDTKLLLPSDRKTTTHTDFAAAGLGRECEFSSPVDNLEEQLYFHEMKTPVLRAENPALGFGVEMRYSLDTLPVLAEWKCMRSGEYVLGLEASNSFVLGRVGERENGTLKVLPPFGSVKTRVELSFYDL